jgi:hypothetical protein
LPNIKGIGPDDFDPGSHHSFRGNYLRSWWGLFYCTGVALRKLIGSTWATQEQRYANPEKDNYTTTHGRNSGYPNTFPIFPRLMNLGFVPSLFLRIVSGFETEYPKQLLLSSDAEGLRVSAGQQKAWQKSLVVEFF